MIGSTGDGPSISITGLGSKVPDRIVTNDELAQYVDTTNEWILERTGIRERRMASKEQALSDVALPACVDALAQAGVEGKDVDLLIVATVTPDMAFPSTAALLADKLGAADAAAYDLSAGCTGFMYALAQAYGMLAGGLARRALVVGGDVLSKILDWGDRSTLVLFGDGAGAVVMEPVRGGGVLGFERGAGGAGSGERRQVWQHLLGLDSARAGRRGRGRAPAGGGARTDDGDGSGTHVGIGPAGVDEGDGSVKGKIAFCFPGQGAFEAGMGRDIAA